MDILAFALFSRAVHDGHAASGRPANLLAFFS